MGRRFHSHVQYPLVLLVPLAVYVAALFFVALFVVEPSALGWLGFAAVALVGVLLASVVAVFFRRAGVNVDRVRKANDGTHRVLLLVDVHPIAGLASEVRAHLRRPSEVLVVSPVLASPLHFVTDDERQEASDARRRLDETLAALSSVGIAATGAVGTDDPLQAIGDALASFPADEIVVVTSDEAHETWLEHRLRAKARDLFGIPVNCVRVRSPSAATRPAHV